MKTALNIERISQASRLWGAMLEHLERTGVRHWVVDDDGAPKPKTYFIGAVEGTSVIGHLSLREQAIECPISGGDGSVGMPILDPDGAPLRELYGQTFVVEQMYRRQGVGLQLQQAGLALARDRLCYQVRSWSSLDWRENYALKVKLGFCVHPAVQETTAGQQVTGVYFVKKV